MIVGDAAAIWILEKVESPRFPYRLRVVRGDETLLALRAQDKWPAAGKNYFCLRDTGRRDDDGPDAPVEIERVPVVSFDRYGRRLAVVLERGRFKRSDFLFLEKTTKGGERYEQIFWRTETAMRQRRPTKKLTLDGLARGLDVVIDSRERYGWTFPECEVTRRALAVGDYALEIGGATVAVVERKTEDNFVAEFGRLPVFHQVLGELEKAPGHALVIEADYARIIDPKRWPQYTPAFRVKAVAEIFAFHPALRVVFASSRKLANEWTRAYFSARKQEIEAGMLPLFGGAMRAAESASEFVAMPTDRPSKGRA